ncbi:MAG TPA: ATP synthase F0 subunit C [Polyangia bacterium]|jgi:F-type H+-transporting ATPase subunit c|nr:ATP synthase F0 subunit C [Polyangia bacterium]
MRRLHKLFVTVAAFTLAALASPAAFAQGDTVHAGGMAAIGAALAIGLAALGGGLGQGRAAASALDGIARNPQASGKIFVPMIVGLALIESLVIYGLIIAFSLASKV